MRDPQDPAAINWKQGVLSDLLAKITKITKKLPATPRKPKTVKVIATKNAKPLTGWPCPVMLIALPAMVTLIILFSRSYRRSRKRTVGYSIFLNAHRYLNLFRKCAIRRPIFNWICLYEGRVEANRRLDCRATIDVIIYAIFLMIVAVCERGKQEMKCAVHGISEKLSAKIMQF